MTRKYIEEIASEESNVSDEDILMTGSSDYIKINIIGTYKSVYGSKRNVFKRGVDSFPKIESSCYSICGENLQKFMNILGQNINSTKPLKIGSFMIDNNTEAILDGNKFFQRHSAILGSTGSGKSWCVANILEKASELKNANIIVFDLHGEYKPLAEEPEKIAEVLEVKPFELYMFEPLKPANELREELITAMDDENLLKLLYKFYLTIK